MSGIADLAVRMKGAGYKLTPSRRAVIRVLETDCRHLNPAEVWEQAQLLYPKVSRATVYRTLDILTRLRCIRPLYLGDSTPRFGSAEGCHHHLVCVRCGSITEIDECVLGDLEERLQRTYRFRPVSHLVELCGVCANCQDGLGDSSPNEKEGLSP